MSNLLPEKQIKDNTRLFGLQYLQHILVWFFLVIVFLLITTIAMRVYVHRSYAVSEKTIQELKNQKLLPDPYAVATLRKQTDMLAGALAKPVPSFSVPTILSLGGAGVSIDTVTTGESGALLVTGTAKTAAHFSQLVAQLKKIKTVTVTESHYATNDATFLISGTVQ